MQRDASVIVAAFNAEASIGRAIDSAIAQRGVTVEIVVADDCSSDLTVQVARRYPRDLVRIVELDRNRGPGGARNVALDAAQGRWIAVLDADDTIHPDRLCRMIGRAERRNAQIVVDNLNIVHETAGGSETMFSQSLLETFDEISLADFIEANLLFEKTSSFGYMKPIFERRFIETNVLRYKEALRIGEDYIFLASALAKGGRCVIEPSAGYAYSVTAGSISRVLELAHVEAMLSADATFMRDHVLDAKAEVAQAKRTRRLEEAASFLSLVRYLKDRAPLKALSAALRDPAALRHLRMPIAARSQRLAAFLQRRKAVGQTR